MLMTFKKKIVPHSLLESTSFSDCDDVNFETTANLNINYLTMFNTLMCKLKKIKCF